MMTRWNWLNLVNRVRLVLESAELTPCYELLGNVDSAMQRSGPCVWCVRILRLLWSTFLFFEALLSFWHLESSEACFVDMPYIWAASALATRAF